MATIINPVLAIVRDGDVNRFSLAIDIEWTPAELADTITPYDLMVTFIGKDSGFRGKDDHLISTNFPIGPVFGHVGPAPRPRHWVIEEVLDRKGPLAYDLNEDQRIVRKESGRDEIYVKAHMIIRDDDTEIISNTVKSNVVKGYF